MDEPRAFTAEEVTEKILEHIRTMVKYWAEIPGQNIKSRCDGVAFSILAMLDGASLELPAITLKLDPHESDKDFCINQGENWFEAGMEIAEPLHELFYKRT